MKQAQLPKHDKAAPRRVQHKPTITHRTERIKPPLSGRALMAFQIAGASLCYLLYALFLSHSSRPWWITLLVGPLVYGSIGAIKHGVDVLFKALLKRRNLHHRRIPLALATTLTAFVGVVLFKVAIHYLG